MAIYSAMGAMFAAITTFPTDRGVVNRCVSMPKACTCGCCGTTLLCTAVGMPGRECLHMIPSGALGWPLLTCYKLLASPVVHRERAGKAYHVAPYYVARFICDMPLRVGQGLLFGVIL